MALLETVKLKTMSYGSETIELFVDMNIGIGGDKWPAAELFGQLVTDERWKPYFSKLFCGKSVVELGAGTGLNSILLDRMFAPRKIVVTDHPSHVELIDRNIKHNQCSAATSAETLDWFAVSSTQEKFDIVMAFEWCVLCVRAASSDSEIYSYFSAQCV